MPECGVAAVDDRYAGCTHAAYVVEVFIGVADQIFIEPTDKVKQLYEDAVANKLKVLPPEVARDG